MLANPNSRSRTALRGLFLLASVIVALPAREMAWTASCLPALSPHIALASVLALREASILAVLALPVVVLAMLIPRWFCHYACPTGTLQELLARIHPNAMLKNRTLLPIGKILVLLTLGGALVGYPLLLWLDPLAIFNSFINAWHRPLTLAALLPGVSLPLLLLFDWLFPHVWCTRVCPLGATQEFLAWPQRCRKSGKRCDVLEPSGTPTMTSRFTAGRREFLSSSAGAALALWVTCGKGQTKSPLRPPGSVAEENFAGVCIRCGNCSQACPAHIIQPDLGTYGFANLLTPCLAFTSDFCRSDCHRCTEVCPSGAIKQLSLEQKNACHIGRAIIDLDICLLASGRECTACIRVCPYHALFIQTSKDGFATEPSVNPDKCNGCGACVPACPVRPQPAIIINGSFSQRQGS
ncbi:MAG: 4Fe-4S binding protein [Verrucomicrobiota bacterium]